MTHMSTSIDSLIRFVQSELGALADPVKAVPMQAYMKTDMPFYGVPKPARDTVLRELKEQFAAATSDEYRTNTLAMWALRHREEKYLAIGYARAFKKFVTFDQIDLYRQMIVEGAWWDLVDEVAIGLVGKVVLSDGTRVRPILEEWIDHENMWLRRSALICQVGHKADTNQKMLFEFCLRRADEKEFFIRKAIGWALREFAKVEPEAVRTFLAANGEKLSGLSRREAGKHL